jgi:hypothetical protein
MPATTTADHNFGAVREKRVLGEQSATALVPKRPLATDLAIGRQVPITTVGVAHAVTLFNSARAASSCSANATLNA